MLNEMSQTEKNKYEETEAQNHKVGNGRTGT